MNSLNHAALGSVADSLHRSVAGLAPGEPGYATMLVRPRPGVGFTSARAAHESAHGHHAVDWALDGGRLELTVEAPPNTAARIVLPDTARGIVVDGQPRACSPRGPRRRRPASPCAGSISRGAATSSTPRSTSRPDEPADSAVLMLGSAIAGSPQTPR